MLELGFTTRDITPTRPAMIQGQMHRRIGHDALDPITVTAWVLSEENDEQAVAIVSCDLAVPTDGLYRAVRKGLAEVKSAIAGDDVILCATHTHDSFVLEDGFYEHPGGDVMTAGECESWVSERIVERGATEVGKVVG